MPEFIVHNSRNCIRSDKIYVDQKSYIRASCMDSPDGNEILLAIFKYTEGSPNRKIFVNDSWKEYTNGSEVCTLKFKKDDPDTSVIIKSLYHFSSGDLHDVREEFKSF